VIFSSPYYLVQYIYWYIRWVWLFTIQKQPFGPEEIEYLTRKKLKMSSIQWQV